MSQFTTEWLSLREPLDIKSHNQNVLRNCVDTFKNHETISICDLGSGTGASVRAISPLLPKQQCWTLVDHDAKNLSAAKYILADWADSTQMTSNGISIRRSEIDIVVKFVLSDLATETSPWPPKTDLVIASALFDLTSNSWISKIINKLSERKLSLLAVLNFDGRMKANPSHVLDERMFESFRAHQKRDKGFGAAAGPNAVSVLEDTLQGYGYKVTSGNSPWRMNSESRPLMNETLRGIAAAVTDTEMLKKSEVKNWLDKRIAQTESLIIGHRDIFARPKEQ